MEFQNQYFRLFRSEALLYQQQRDSFNAFDVFSKELSFIIDKNFSRVEVTASITKT